MTWYYAVGSQQQGPVTEDQLHALAKDGVVTGDTLVWRDGMANWQPYRTISGAVLAPPPAPSVNLPAAAPSATPASSGAELSEQQVLEREYRVEIGEALDRGWKVFTGNAGVIIGVGLVWLVLMVGIFFVSAIASLIPLLNLLSWLVTTFLNGPIMAGVLFFFVRMIRGGPGQFGDTFSGFGPRFIHLGMTSLLQGLINLALLLPAIVTCGLLGLLSAAVMKSGRFPELSVATIGALAAVGSLTFLVLVYVNVLWTFSLLLVLDKRYDFWPAMQLSRRMVNRRWWMTFLFLFVGGLISGAGTLACFIGLFVTVPLYFGMYAHLYDANFRELAPARRE
jgi:hypothetical protein